MPASLICLLYERILFFLFTGIHELYYNPIFITVIVLALTPISLPLKFTPDEFIIMFSIKENKKTPPEDRHSNQ